MNNTTVSANSLTTVEGFFVLILRVHRTRVNMLLELHNRHSQSIQPYPVREEKTKKKTLRYLTSFTDSLERLKAKLTAEKLEVQTAGRKYWQTPFIQG